MFINRDSLFAILQVSQYLLVTVVELLVMLFRLHCRLYKEVSLVSSQFDTDAT